MSSNVEMNVPLIGDNAPEFKAITTAGKINFPDDYKGKWVVLFSHPADFTPVCSTEFMTFARMYKEFQSMNVELIGLSVDSLTSHIQWLKDIEEKMRWDGYEGEKIEFPLIADISMTVAKKYGMIQPNAANTQAVRAVFAIDPDAVIRALIYYPASTGRNFDEIKRLMLALQKSDSTQKSTPANWMPGDDLILRNPVTSADAEQRVNEMKDSDDDYNSMSWYLTFAKDK